MTDYVTLSTADKLLIARDTLRGRESDRFRISLLSEPNKEQRLADLDADIERIAGVVSELEAEVEAEAAASVEEDEPVEPIE